MNLGDFPDGPITLTLYDNRDSYRLTMAAFSKPGQMATWAYNAVISVEQAQALLNELDWDRGPSGERRVVVSKQAGTSTSANSLK